MQQLNKEQKILSVEMEIWSLLPNYKSRWEADGKGRMENQSRRSDIYWLGVAEGGEKLEK